MILARIGPASRSRWVDSACGARQTGPGYLKPPQRHIKEKILPTFA